ncbi:hypothetical protein evm_012262 [Chilo suppressalis]|nr:hypothetical protein evm_012262 [Chilo suppressalis]
MGGSLSHEWQVCARAGEDLIEICPSCSHAAIPSQGKQCSRCGSETDTHSCIEVGHTFILGTKYSEPLKAQFTSSSGVSEPLIMSCYGIGITRLLAASLEALSTDTCLRWPRPIAPYSAIIVGPKEGSKEWLSHADSIEQVYHQLDSIPSLRGDVIIDDRHNMTIGKRLMMADRLGFPLAVVLGKSMYSGQVEVYRSTPGRQFESQLMTLQQMKEERTAINN